MKYNKEIENYLEQYRNREIYYIPNPGNAGDSLIATATFQLLKKFEIKYCLPNPKSFNPKEKIIFYGGGGNLIGNSTFSAKILRRCHYDAKKFVLLPHTIKSVDDIVDVLGSNVDIICREKRSYDYVCEKTNKPNVFLMDDMAISLNVSEIMGQTNKNMIIYSIFQYFYNKLFGNKLIGDNNNVMASEVIRAINVTFFKKDFLANHIKNKVNCFRTDGDSPKNLMIPKENIDLSTVFQFGVGIEKLANLATYMVLNYLSKTDEVHTNRLHMAIAGALLGKKVKLYPNAYYKCYEVYNYSLKDRFQNVQWVNI
jgi:exopolysaccharide biosynthesis predicted pyruvyltransferase EpsI